MKLTTDEYDVAGSGIGRTWRQAAIYGLIPVGRAERSGGPGWWLCARLWLWHRFGGGACRLAMRFEKQAISVYAFLARLKKLIGDK